MTDMTVANTILAQLGGNRFAMMTGAKNFSGSDTMLMFAVPKARNGIKGVRITLDPSDTYTVRFVGKMFNTIKEVEGVYNDQLQEIFTRETGLYTRL